MALPSTKISGSNSVFEDSELVLGLVAPVGTNFDKFENLLERCLKKFGYTINPVRLSTLTNNFQVEPISSMIRSRFIHRSRVASCLISL